MKHGLRLTRKQKIFVRSKHLIPDHWLCIRNTQEDFWIIHKASGKIKKFVRS